MRIIEELVQNTIDGIEDPLLAYGMLSEIMEKAKKGIAEIKDAAMIEAEKHPTTFECHGFKFQRKNGAARYDFKGIAEWESLDQSKKVLEQKLKSAFKANEKGVQQVSEDGEILQLPKQLFNSDSLSVKKS